MRINNVRFESREKAVCDLFDSASLQAFVEAETTQQQPHLRVVRVSGVATVEIELEPEQEGDEDGHR